MDAPQHLPTSDPGRKSRAYPIPDLSLEASQFCQEHGMELDELVCHDRRPALAHLRQKFYYRLLEATDYPIISIGRALERDHTTILHGAAAYAKRNGLPLRVRPFAHPTQRRRFWKSDWRPHWWRGADAS
jgi:hypothetical protein